MHLFIYFLEERVLKKRFIKSISILMSVVLICGMISGCTMTDPMSSGSSSESLVQKPEHAAKDTLVVGCDSFSDNLSPFYASSDGNKTLCNLTMQPLLIQDRDGEMVKLGIEGQIGSFKGTFYTYNGIADCTVAAGEDGKVDYSFTLREGVRFSDGVPMTADDVIFTMYVLADPIYDGPWDFSKLPIEGMEEYRSDMDTLFNLLVDAGRDNEDFAYWDEKTQKGFWTDLDNAGELFVKEIVDRLKSAGYNGKNDSVAECMKTWGYDISANATERDVFRNLCEYYGGDVLGMSKVESAGSSITDLMDNYDVYKKIVSTDAKIDNITGIRKTGDMSFTITMTEFDIKSIYSFGFYIAALHHYGNTDLYDYEKNRFGFEKGDIASVMEKNDAFGAGAYIYTGYEDGVVSLEANDSYWKGAPEIKKINLVKANAGEKLNSLVVGDLDMVNISMEPGVLTMIKSINSNGELNGNKLSTELYEKLGYGYVGISAANVKVGSDASTTASKSLRKAFATMFSFYRSEAILGYYNEMAEVIDYPVSKTFWAAPQNKEENYKAAFSTGTDGNSIYTDEMNHDEREKAMIGAVVEFLKEAGFKYDDAKKVFTEAPDGAKMEYEAVISAHGIGDHPSYEIFKKSKAVLKEMGISLIIKDVASADYIWDLLDNNKAEIWAAAWGAVREPNLYQNYHSDNYITGRYTNYFAIQSDKLDEIINNILVTIDEPTRAKLYREGFDEILDWAVEVPVYERKNALIYKSNVIDSSTLPKDMGIYWDWTAEVETLKFVPSMSMLEWN